MPASKEMFGVLYLINKFRILRYRTRLQKLVFMAKQKYKYPFSFSHEYYLYGPYSSDLQNYLINLVSDGIIEEKSGETFYIYRLTPTGKEILEMMKDKMNEEDTKKLDRLISECKEDTLPQLVSKAKKLFETKKS